MATYEFTLLLIRWQLPFSFAHTIKGFHTPPLSNPAHNPTEVGGQKEQSINNQYETGLSDKTSSGRLFFWPGHTTLGTLNAHWGGKWREQTHCLPQFPMPCICNSCCLTLSLAKSDLFCCCSFPSKPVPEKADYVKLTSNVQSENLSLNKDACERWVFFDLVWAFWVPLWNSGADALQFYQYFQVSAPETFLFITQESD